MLRTCKITHVMLDPKSVCRPWCVEHREYVFFAPNHFVVVPDRHYLTCGAHRAMDVTHSHHGVRLVMLWTSSETVRVAKEVNNSIASIFTWQSERQCIDRVGVIESWALYDIIANRRAGLVPLLGVRLQMYCANRAGLVPLLGLRLQMYCANRAVPVPLPGVRLQMHCVNRAGLVPVLGVRLQMYCANRAGLVPLLGVRWGPFAACADSIATAPSGLFSSFM